MKASAGQIGGLLDKPAPATRLYLFHGPDEAGANELAARLARALGPDADRVDLEPRLLRDQPGLLADEAASLSLFGGRRLLRVTGVDDGASEAMALLLGAPRVEHPVVAIGAGLKSSSRLVKMATAAPGALVFACYVPEGPEAARLATGMAREHGLRLAGDVAQRLAAATNGDRAILAREIEKLALYLDAAPERPRDADSARSKRSAPTWAMPKSRGPSKPWSRAASPISAPSLRDSTKPARRRCRCCASWCAG